MGKTASIISISCGILIFVLSLYIQISTYNMLSSSSLALSGDISPSLVVTDIVIKLIGLAISLIGIIFGLIGIAKKDHNVRYLAILGVILSSISPFLLVIPLALFLM